MGSVRGVPAHLGCLLTLPLGSESSFLHSSDHPAAKSVLPKAGKVPAALDLMQCSLELSHFRTNPRTRGQAAVARGPCHPRP